jgi:hypothetical protein
MAESKNKPNKILKHPDKEEIIRRLNDGESIRAVEMYLKKLYPRSPHLRLSGPTIQNFRKNNLNLEGKVLKDLQENGKEQKKQIEEQIVQRQLEQTNAYQDKINKIANNHLDVSSRLIQLDSIVGDRIEYYYNLSKSGEEVSNKADQELRKFIDQQILLLGQYKKLVEGMADKTIDYNINVNILNDQVNVMRDAIRELIAEELGIDGAVSFMDKLQKRLKQTSYKYRAPEEVETINLEETRLPEFQLTSEAGNVQR